jgi:signal transduction histidine kinase
MKGFRRWVAACLWRRLAFYHLVAIFGTLVMVQLIVAALTMATSGAAPVPGTGTVSDLAPWVRFAGYLFGAALGTVPALLLSALVAAISGIIVSRSLGRRLSPLEQTARQMADGDLTLRIEDISPDEIGRVGQAFDQMAGQLQDSLQALKAEKGRVEALLHARRNLVTNISHDLRTPIASLAAHLETLSEHPERLDAYLPILSDETDRVSGLIDDLFELSRLDARELELDLSPVALCDVIERVVTTYKRLAWEQRRIVLEACLPDGLPPVQADVQRTEQVLVNLVANALRFTPEGGIVTIEAEARPKAVEVRVSDTGIGIPPEDLPYIFERSYRGDRARTLPRPGDRLGSGSGLGLAIVKGLVEAMGGAVDATSALGEGTCVCFLLPLAEGCSPSQSV